MVRQTKTVAVGMSGGVDSSLAAYLLLEQGYDVIGVTALMSPELSRCCSEEDVEMAAKLAARLGFRHEIVDLREKFQERIINYFGDEYLAGRTPSPCVVCNREIKFGLLAERAREMGADMIATGHYAAVKGDSEKGWGLFRGADRVKDQSYFLAMLSQDQLSTAIFPLGEMQKSLVSNEVSRLKLMSRESKESQEICFIPEGRHGDWLGVRRLDSPGSGRVLDSDGRCIGEHMGIHHYTIGQRKGLGVALGYPVYVADIDSKTNTITVGPREAVMKSRLQVKGVNWMQTAPRCESFEADVQIRYNHKAAPATVRMQDDGSAEVVFAEAQFAITPGQLCVFYDKDMVMAGGWIMGNAER